MSVILRRLGYIVFDLLKLFYGWQFGCMLGFELKLMFKLLTLRGWVAGLELNNIATLTFWSINKIQFKRNI